MNAKIVVACAIPVAFFATALARSLPALNTVPQSSAESPLVLKLPAQWVPLTATQIQRMPGMPDQLGMYYRRSDGSTASVFEGTDGSIVTIHNRQTGRTYVQFGSEGWVSHPLRPEDAPSPKTEMRLKRSRVKQFAESIHGLQVYELAGGKPGAVARIAPGLNGLLVFQREPNGAGVEYRDIALGEPPDHVFLPPPGVEVRSVAFEDLVRPRR